MTFITLSSNLSTPTTFPINQLINITSTVFYFPSPTLKKFKTISNHFSSLSFPPHILRTANINTRYFQSLRYYPPLSHKLCWKPDSKLYIRRFSYHSSMSAYSIFLLGFSAFFLMLTGTDSTDPFNTWMPFQTQTNNQRILETQTFIMIPALALNQPKMTHKAVSL